MEENTKKNKGGRPRAEIDKTQFEQLCALQCTLVEFCAWFDVADKTLESWCKRTYGAGFYEVFEKKRSKGKISLRRFQFQQAEKNPTMAIWLGKQWLGQSDRMAVKASIEAKTDPLSAAFEALSNETE